MSNVGITVSILSIGKKAIDDVAIALSVSQLISMSDRIPDLILKITAINL
jgi:hypothetical protein